MADYHIQPEPHPTLEDCNELTAKLVAYNVRFVGTDPIDRIGVFVRNDAGEVKGGAIGWVKWNWLSVDIVWLSDELRGKGIGRELLNQIEQLAAGRGCDNVHLDTFDFQAREFYQKQGYEIFGTLDDYSNGHQRFYLKKRLDPISSPNPSRNV